MGYLVVLENIGTDTVSNKLGLYNVQELQIGDLIQLGVNEVVPSDGILVNFVSDFKSQVRVPKEFEEFIIGELTCYFENIVSSAESIKKNHIAKAIVEHIQLKKPPPQKYVTQNKDPVIQPRITRDNSCQNSAASSENEINISLASNNDSISEKRNPGVSCINSLCSFSIGSVASSDIKQGYGSSFYSVGDETKTKDNSLLDTFHVVKENYDMTGKEGCATDKMFKNIIDSSVNPENPDDCIQQILDIPGKGMVGLTCIAVGISEVLEKRPSRVKNECISEYFLRSIYTPNGDLKQSTHKTNMKHVSFFENADEDKDGDYDIGNSYVICAYCVGDSVRETTKHVVEYLKSSGVQVWLVSGDSNASVRNFASKVGIEECIAETHINKVPQIIKLLQENRIQSNDTGVEKSNDGVKNKLAKKSHNSFCKNNSNKKSRVIFVSNNSTMDSVFNAADIGILMHTEVELARLAIVATGILVPGSGIGADPVLSQGFLIALSGFMHLLNIVFIKYCRVRLLS
ncbi:hypothetical protein AX774_g7545 [Zancudomyces culisetae]|uniref:Uncharacterized protein n=1 Tax=Zancudomyces culisetae TaxID=1213189 RepID=A0A1R1PDM7_ZANCU|nr:hypothetical protein AX774_g7545 [Zancudomyces culisetae]|eukprot:OMH79051.1 hypothetical protein AX774_g7545 [Zancudomyces culisetae]